MCEDKPAAQLRSNRGKKGLRSSPCQGRRSREPQTPERLARVDGHQPGNLKVARKDAEDEAATSRRDKPDGAGADNKSRAKPGEPTAPADERIAKAIGLSDQNNAKDVQDEAVTIWM